MNADYSQQRAVYRRPLNTKEVFVELVSQRLAQGFQLVIRSQAERAAAKTPSSTLMRGVHQVETEASEEYLLSIGRIFHRIKLTGSTITVTRYRPRYRDLLLSTKDLKLNLNECFTFECVILSIDIRILQLTFFTNTDLAHQVAGSMKGQQQSLPLKSWKPITGTTWIITFALGGIQALY